MAGSTQVERIAANRDVAVTSGASFTPDQTEVIRNLFAKGATDDELVVFLRLAEKYDLDPFAREIWCICELNPDGTRKLDKNGDLRPPMIQASRAGWRKVAQRDGRCAGIEAAAVYSKDTLERLADGGIRHVICLDVDEQGRQDRGKIVGAYALVWRHDWTRPAYAWATWQDYGAGQVSDDKGNKRVWSPWYKFPSAMIEKQAESMALRQAFPLGAMAAGDDREVEAVDAGQQPALLDPPRDESGVVDVEELPGEPDTPHARGTRPAPTGAPRPAPAASEAADLGDEPSGSGRPDVDASPTGIALIGALPLEQDDQASTEQVSRLRKASRLKQDELARVVAWATRRDGARATRVVGNLPVVRCAELEAFYDAADAPARARLVAVVEAWEADLPSASSDSQERPQAASPAEAAAPGTPDAPGDGKLL